MTTTAVSSRFFPEVDTSVLLRFLGESPQHPEFAAWLDAHGIETRPHLAEQDPSFAEDGDLAYENARASEIDEVERHSVCLIYEDSDNFERLFERAPATGAFVLKQVAFYAPGVQGYRGYAGQLPRGLRFDLTRSQVQERLGMPTASRVIHGLAADLYLDAHWAINVSYLDGGQVGIVHVRPLHRFDRRMLGLAASDVDADAVDLQQLISLLGVSTYDETLEGLLEPLGWQSADFDMADCDEVPNLIPRHGIALYYRNAAEYPQLQKRELIRDGSVFAGFRVNRRGDMLSDGYEGRLPFDIQFHDTPEQVIARVGRAADAQVVDLDTAALKWKLPGCILHVMYSLIDWQVYRVTCFAPFLEDELFARRY